MKQFYRATNGPERELEDSVVKKAPALFSPSKYEQWMGGSLPVGAGLPDILIAAWRPEVIALSGADKLATSVIAYLRGVSFASPDTIAFRLRQPTRKLEKCAEHLWDAGIITSYGSKCALTDAWRSILPDVVAVEVKVKNWRSAIAQASRNSIFAHRSYVAMPARVAAKLKFDETVIGRGLGIISISGDEVEIVKRPKRLSPKVWQYYYSVATIIASDIAKHQDGLRYKN